MSALADAARAALVVDDASLGESRSHRLSSVRDPGRHGPNRTSPAVGKRRSRHRAQLSVIVRAPTRERAVAGQRATVRAGTGDAGHAHGRSGARRGRDARGTRRARCSAAECRDAAPSQARDPRRGAPAHHPGDTTCRAGREARHSSALPLGFRGCALIELRATHVTLRAALAIWMGRANAVQATGAVTARTLAAHQGRVRDRRRRARPRAHTSARRGRPDECVFHRRICRRKRRRGAARHVTLRAVVVTSVAHARSSFASDLRAPFVARKTVRETLLHHVVGHGGRRAIVRPTRPGCLDLDAGR